MNKRKRRTFRWDRAIVVIAILIAITNVLKVSVNKNRDETDAIATKAEVVDNNSSVTIENAYTISGGNLDLISYASTTTSIAVATKVTTTTSTTTTPISTPTTTSVYSSRLNRYMSDYEMYLLTMITCSEAGFESYEGKVAVAATILNRMESPIFPDGVYDVIFQPYQFSSATNGVFHNSITELKYEDLSVDMLTEAKSAVEAALNGEDPTENVTGGALFFYNPDYCSDAENAMRSNLSCTLRIGNHIFYREWD